MSAFAVWVVAAEEAFGWEPGKIMEIYKANRGKAESDMLEFHSIASSLMRFMSGVREFSGTYSDLMGHIILHTSPGETLPKTSHGFAAELRRIRPALERAGFQFYFNGRSSDPKQKGRTLMSIVNTAEAA